MCGRYGRRGSKQKVAEAFHVRHGLDETDFDETFDAAPGSIQPVVRMGDEGRTLENMRWGFKLADCLLFNTRSEGALTSKFWKDRVKQRCIVPASMYFEWPDGAPKPKPKFEITVPGAEYFGIAAVYGPWKNPKTDNWETAFSAFTSEPNSLIQKIHFRQPVILEPRDYQEWLDPSERFPSHLLRVVPEDRMRMIQIASALPPYHTKTSCFTVEES
jgi:putative SOS response-associated peptidase YedK